MVGTLRRFINLNLKKRKVHEDEKNVKFYVGSGFVVDDRLYPQLQMAGDAGDPKCR